MHRLIQYARRNAIAFAALFVALGGTGYAAMALPSNSVGRTQLRAGAVTANKLAIGAVTTDKVGDGVVTPKKLKESAFGGQIRFSAQIDPFGRVLVSQPRGATTSQWNNDPAATALFGGVVTWHRAIPSNCFAMASSAQALQSSSNQPAYASAQLTTGSAQHAQVVVLSTGRVQTNVVIICP